MKLPPDIHDRRLILPHFVLAITMHSSNQLYALRFLKAIIAITPGIFVIHTQVSKIYNYKICALRSLLKDHNHLKDRLLGPSCVHSRKMKVTICDGLVSCTWFVVGSDLKIFMLSFYGQERNA